MKKSLLLSSLSLAGMVAGGSTAQAQMNYQDLRGQFMQLTGVLNYNIIADIDGLITTTLSGSATIVPSQMANFTFATTGPANDSTLSSTIPLPPIGGILDFPPLAAVGNFNETSGALSLYGDLPGTTSITVAAVSGTSTITITVTVTNPNLTFLGQDTVESTATDSAIITNTATSSLTWTSISLTALSLPTTLLPGTSVTLAPWTLSAITPAPSAVAIFGPGIMGGMFALRRRRVRRLRSNEAMTGEGSAGSRDSLN